MADSGGAAVGAGAIDGFEIGNGKTAKQQTAVRSDADPVVSDAQSIAQVTGSDAGADKKDLIVIGRQRYQSLARFPVERLYRRSEQCCRDFLRQAEHESDAGQDISA